MIQCKQCRIEITSLENKRTKGICMLCDLRNFANDDSRPFVKYLFMPGAERGEAPIVSLKRLGLHGCVVTDSEFETSTKYRFDTFEEGKAKFLKLAEAWVGAIGKAHAPSKKIKIKKDANTYLLEGLVRIDEVLRARFDGPVPEVSELIEKYRKLV